MTGGRNGDTKRHYLASRKIDRTVSDVIEAVRPMFGPADIADAVTFLRKSGQKIDTNSLIDAVYVIRERKPEDPKQQQQQQQTLITVDKTACDPEILHSGEVSGNCSSSDDDSDVSGEGASMIDRAKLFYKQRIAALEIVCQSCRQRNADILLLPCAHLACCKYCLKDIRRCPVLRCKKVVRGTKEVFFVG